MGDQRIAAALGRRSIGLARSGARALCRKYFASYPFLSLAGRVSRPMRERLGNRDSLLEKASPGLPRTAAFILNTGSKDRGGKFRAPPTQPRSAQTIHSPSPRPTDCVTRVAKLEYCLLGSYESSLRPWGPPLPYEGVQLVEGAASKRAVIGIETFSRSIGR